MVDFIKFEEFVVPANTFTFPYNSKSLDITGETTQEVTDLPFTNYAISISNGTYKTRIGTFQGHFSGNTKNTDYDDLKRILTKPVLKKFFFNPNRFMFFIEGDSSQIFNANRSAFIDYIVVLKSIVHYFFGDTLKTASFNPLPLPNGTWTNGTLTNDGNYKTNVESIEVTLSGGSPGDTIILENSKLFGVKVILPAYINGDTLKIDFISVVETNGLSIAKTFIPTFNGITRLGRSVPSGKNFIGLELQEGERVDTILVSGTASFSNIDVNFRDGFSNI